MPNVLIVGATRGLGRQLAEQYAAAGNSVHGTARSTRTPEDSHEKVQWISGVDIAQEKAGKTIATGLKGQKQDLVIITAGYFATESFDEPDFEKEVHMYKTSAYVDRMNLVRDINWLTPFELSIGPVFIVHALHKAGLLAKGSKIILVSSESGSITLRHESEGGGNYGHHASKSAVNMVGKLLSLDLKDAGVAVGIVHPGFMRTEMTKGVGFDKFWDDGGAVTPDVAANSLIEWIEKDFDMSKAGTYWAPRGPG